MTEHAAEARKLRSAEFFSVAEQPPATVSLMASHEHERGRIDNIGMYMMLANKTLSPEVGESWKDVMLNAATGLSSETGEINEIVKKHFFHFHPMDEAMVTHLRKETGDLAWYIALLCLAMKWDPATILAENIEKLRARYPQGFTTENSINRAPGDI